MKEVLYETKRLKVARILTNLKEMEVSEYSKLNSKFDDVCYNSKIDLDEKIRLLDEIENDLSSYNEIFKLKSKSAYLNSTISSVRDVNKFNECSFVAKSLLSSYFKLRQEGIFINSSLVYASIYKTIKKELLFNKKSELFDMVKDDELFCSKLDEHIRLDIDEIMNSLNYNSAVDMIRTKMNELNMNGLDSSLVSIDIINLIGIFDNYKEYQDKYEKVIFETRDNLSRNLEDFYSSDGYLIDKAQNQSEILSSLESKWSKYYGKLLSKYVSIILSLSLFGGVGYSISKLPKNVGNVDVYKTITQSYIDGRSVEVNESYETKNSKEVTRTLEIAGELYHSDSNTYRLLYVYDLTNIILDSIEDYAKLDLKYYEIRNNSNSELYDVTLMEKGDKRVTIVTQDYSDSKKDFSEFKYNCILSILYGLEALCLIFPFSPINRIRDLIKYTKNYKNDNKIYEETEKVFLEILKTLNDLINENLKITEKYDEIRDELIKVFDDENKDIQEIESMLSTSEEYMKKVKVLNERVK